MSAEAVQLDANYFDERLLTPEVDGFRPTRIGIIDAGSQLLKPIDRRLRELGVDTIILPIDIPADQLLELCDAYVV
jgi:hypothetical protein